MGVLRSGVAPRAAGVARWRWCGAAAALGLVAWAGVPAALAQGGAPVAAAVATVKVERYEVQGNTLLRPEALQARLAPYRGELSLPRLREAAATVQDMYREAGYGGVVAFLPEQPLDAGVVRIRVVEGKLADIEVTQNRQFSLANVRASLPSLVTGRTPDVRRIDAEIQLANENPAKQVQVLLQPGRDPASIAARLTVVEQPVQRFTARADNTGGERTGRWRAALGWQHANVADLDHVLAAELQTAPQKASSLAVLSASYRAPLYGRALALDAYGAYSDVDAGKVATQAGDLAFSGKGTILGTRLSAYLPRYLNIDQRLLLGLEGREYLNSCSISGLPQGACGAAGESVSVQPLSLTYTAQTVGEVRAGLSVGLHHNLAFGGRHGAQSDFDAVRRNSARRYTLLRASGQFSLPAGEWGLLAARAQVQFSPRPLVPGELFGVGGAQSVRGFEEREIGGDTGAQISVELAGPPLGDRLNLPGLDLRGLLFADAGWVNNRQGDSCLAGRDDCRIAGLGAGLRLSGAQWQLRLDLARALTAASSTRKGDVRAHVAASAHF